ncbi:hypothetical protein HYX13_04840 [Candidatus Woesearchaeota archaeon]|nr:hypothetical protein [Candidatus Woesearchaeota archaeon]
MARGKFVVVDGIDGVGKGVFLKTLLEEAQTSGKQVFDVHEYWKEHNYHPSLTEIEGTYTVLHTSEPTFAGVGRLLRQEMIAKTGRFYGPEAVAEAYALDRRILYEQLLLPALEKGIDVFQSRSFSTSIVYQRQSALDQGKDFSAENILSIPGNAFCIQHPMDFLLVPTIVDTQEALRRAGEREKQDNCIFENLDFQLKIKQQYESEEFQVVFQKLGVPVKYLDAGVSIDFSQQQAREFYENFLK